MAATVPLKVNGKSQTQQKGFHLNKIDELLNHRTSDNVPYKYTQGKKNI